MMWIWTHRPRFLHLGLFSVAYLLGGGFAQSLAIVPGTGISIWPPSGLFIATLVLAPRRSWPWWVLGACVAELIGNVLWFKSPLPAALLIYAGNALEAVTGAWLVNRALGRPVRLETLQDVLIFIVLGAGIAPVAAATVGAATVTWFGMQSQTFTGAWPLFWIGDATGVLIVAPLALALFQNWPGKAPLSRASWMEAGLVALIFLGAAAFALSGYLPFAYIIMPPLLWAAVRFEFKGAAIALTLLALVTAAFTISGASQFAGDPASQREKQIMLHLFLAVSALSALIVAAISRQHQSALLALRENERRLQQFIDAVPALIWSTTAQGMPTYLNKRYTDVTGAVLEDLIAPDGSAAPLNVVHPDDREASAAIRAQAFAAGAPYLVRYRQIRRDGSYHWTETRAEPLRDDSGAILQWYGVSVDIHDMVTAQEALRHRERELSQLVDIVPSFLWRLSPEGEPVFFSKRMIAFTGLDVGDCDKPGMTGLTAAISALVHPDDTAQMEAALSRCLATGESFSLNYRLRRADGVYRWMSGRAEPMRDDAGRIVQWYGLSHDIHDQMRAEETLRNSKGQLEQMIDAVPINILSFSPTGDLTYASRRYLEQVGSPTEDIQDFDALARDLAHPEDYPAMFQRASEGFATGQPFVNRFRRRCKDGVYRWIEARAQPLHDAHGAIVQWYIASIDIDGEVQAQEDLRQAQEKMARASQAASLAELSASIAHEVNQPLAAIVATSHACRRWMSAEPPNLERAKITLDRIIRDANSASEVVSRIRALFNQMNRTRSPADVTAVIAEVRRLLADELATRNIQVESEFDRDLPPALIDRVQIQQVLANLIRNAIDASDKVADGAKLIRLRAVRDGGDAIRVEVQDQGAGIAEQERIFEPFFTTKKNGMGMGLAICRSIIDSHNGRLWATGNQPRGTTFAFTLPIGEREAI